MLDCFMLFGWPCARIFVIPVVTGSKDCKRHQAVLQTAPCGSAAGRIPVSPVPSCGCDVGGLPQPIAWRSFSQPPQTVLIAALLRRAPRQGVPRRVASLTSLVDSFVNEQGGDRPIHRLGTQASGARSPMCGLSRRHHPVLPGRAATVPQPLDSRWLVTKVSALSYSANQGLQGLCSPSWTVDFQASSAPHPVPNIRPDN